MLTRAATSESAHARATDGRQYRLLRELASGSFGTVYLAEMLGAGDFRKQVALKVLHPDWSPRSEAAVRFRDEARLLGQIRHRHVVQVDGLVQFGGRWAVVMEYVPGVDCSTLVKAARRAKEAVPVSAALEVVGAVALALDAAWNALSDDGQPLQVIHRDIKPANVRITPDGDVKVLDFGIARADFEGREAETQEIRFGTLRYMSPERRWGKPDTTAGDIYSLGCLLFELIAGGPFGNAEGLPQEHARRLEERLTLLEPRVGDDGGEIVALVRAMMAYSADDRPTANEIFDRTRVLVRGRRDEDLSAYARRFVPDVPKWIPDESVEVARPGAGSASARPTSLTGELLTGGTPGQPRREWLRAAIATGLGAAVVLLIAAVVVAGSRLVGGGAEIPATDAPNTPDGISTEVTGSATGAIDPPRADEPPVDPPVETAPPPEAHEEVAAPPDHAAPPPIRPSEPTDRPAEAQEPPPAERPTGPTLRAVKFTLPSATAMEVDCAGTIGRGTTYVYLRDAPAGACVIRATVSGRALVTTVDVKEARGVDCWAEGGEIKCR